MRRYPAIGWLHGRNPNGGRGLIGHRELRFTSLPRMRFPAAAAVIVLWAGAASAECLRIAGPRDARCLPLRGGTFQLSWIHSVERTEWRETYDVEAGGLVLTASEFSSAGAGLPDRLLPGEVFHNQSDKMRIDHRHIPIPDLRIRLSPLSHHVLHTDGRDFDLTALFGESVVSIGVQRGASDEPAPGSSRRRPLLRALSPRG
jgi:hypothetical protein